MGIVQTKKAQKIRVTLAFEMNLIVNKIPEVAEIRVSAKFYPAECSGLWVIVLTERIRKKEKKNCDDAEAENNTAVTFVGSTKHGLECIRPSLDTPT